MTHEELKDKVAQVFREAEPSYVIQTDFKVEVEEDTQGEIMTVHAFQMYDYLPLSFSILQKLSEIFGTTDFGVSQYERSGCETCDYGSCYSHTFTFKRGN